MVAAAKDHCAIHRKIVYGRVSDHTVASDENVCYVARDVAWRGRGGRCCHLSAEPADSERGLRMRSSERSNDLTLEPRHPMAVPFDEMSVSDARQPR